MSVQAMAFAIEQQQIQDPPARHVLLVLANYAGKDGRNAFPSVATLAIETGLSERTVRSKLELLKSRGLIVEGNQQVAAAEIRRADRRPTVYDIPMSRGASLAPRIGERGANDDHHGVHLTVLRGAGDAPDPKSNHQKREPSFFRSFRHSSSATADFSQARYYGTPKHELPPELRGVAE